MNPKSDFYVKMQYENEIGQTIIVTNTDLVNGVRAIEIEFEGEGTHTLYLYNEKELDDLIGMLTKLKDFK